MGQQHPPVRPEPVEDALPVEPVAVGRMMWATSAPSKRSRSMTKALDQSVSSAGAIFTVQAEDFAGSACSNHSSSTVAMPLPELKITSMKASRERILASQWEKHQLGLVAGRGARLEQPLHVARADEDVEVLGGPVDPGLVQRTRTRRRRGTARRHG